MWASLESHTGAHKEKWIEGEVSHKSKGSTLFRRRHPSYDSKRTSQAAVLVKRCLTIQHSKTDSTCEVLSVYKQGF